VPGGGAALLHLAELVPEFSASLSDSEERLGADLVGKARACPPPATSGPPCSEPRIPP
jgi:chaperonin GroEL (HSP60 family)